MKHARSRVLDAFRSLHQAPNRGIPPKRRHPGTWLARLIPALALAGATAVPVSAQTTPPASPPDALFVPGDYVPLSEFKEILTPTAQVTLTVRPDILTWVQGQPGASLLLAVENPLNGNVTFSAAPPFDPVTGVFTIAWAVPAKYVIVADNLLNNYPIETHWDAALNGNRGGRRKGATDGLQSLYLDISANELALANELITRSTDETHGFPIGINQYEPYEFATNLYALFSDGTGANDNADLPGFERYIGETYSLVAPTDLAATWLSDQTRGAWGYPVSHKNASSAFSSSVPKEAVVSGCPVFQIAHAHTVKIGNIYTMTQGSENSLASFVMPPTWDTTNDPPYPAVFNGFYDINGNTFNSWGPKMLDILGELFVDHSELAVGMLWNGGGAQPCQTMHLSAYNNANQLIQDAQALIGADPHQLVMAGGSRGGTTALEMASNPFQFPYTVHYVYASNPQVRTGQNLDVFGNPTYDLVQRALVAASGYKNAWKPLFTDPDPANPPRSGVDLALETYFGTSDRTLIDTSLVSYSDTFVSELKANGTQVVFRAGTHDYSKPFSQLTDYVSKLRANNINTSLLVSYRRGHGTYADDGPAVVADLMLKVLGLSPVNVPNTDSYLKPDPMDHQQGIPFTAGHLPLVLEAPLLVGANQPHTYELVGPDGALYVIYNKKLENGVHCLMNYLSWPPDILFAGTLTSTHPNGFGTDTISINWPIVPSGFEGYWALEAKYSVNGGASWEPQLSTGSFSAPNSCSPGPRFLLDNSGPVHGLSDNTRTGGLSADVNF